MKASLAIEADIIAIQKLSSELDLDCEDFSYEQFVVVKKEESLIGIGRLRRYAACTELATLGITPKLQKQGIGRLLVSKLIEVGPNEIFVTCVIPTFFLKFGFQQVKNYPLILQKKVDFCKSFDYSDGEVFVMKIVK